MVEVFKTNVQAHEQSNILLQKLSDLLPGSRINFDLDDCDKILRVEAESICHTTIITLLKSHGFSAEVLI
jgi:hypothetical protein